MKKREKQAVAVAVLLLLTGFVSYVTWGKGTLPQSIRNVVESSLQEDFRIKESLGKLFFAQKEENATTVSIQANLISLQKPAEGDVRATEENNGAIFACNRFSAVLATEDGVIETVEEDRLTLRHTDGKLSVYQHVGTLWKAGKTVKRGDTVGYATGEVVYRLYAGGVLVDPRPYFTA